MFKMVKGKKGFTLIELMIVVAIVGILAAIAIPAYLDYTVKAKITEVSAAMDALATAASEYHASVGKFPDDADAYVNVSGFAAVSTDYVSGWNYIPGADRNLTASFYANINVTAAFTTPSQNNIVMNVIYNPVSGYSKVWDDARSDIENKYLPKK